MKSLIINYNTTTDNYLKDKNIKTINKNFLYLEDLEIIDNNLNNNDFILIKNDKLIQRKDFDFDNFDTRFINEHPEIDIFILSSYNEKCSNLTKVDHFDDYTFFKDVSPGELEAFVIRKENWSKIKDLFNKSKEEKINNKIKNLVLNDELKAVFSWPQVFYSKEDYKLMSICRVEKEGFINPRIKEISFYWFAVTFIFSIIFMYLIYDKIPKDRFFYMKKNEK